MVRSQSEPSPTAPRMADAVSGSTAMVASSRPARLSASRLWKRIGRLATGTRALGIDRTLGQGRFWGPLPARTSALAICMPTQRLTRPPSHAAPAHNRTKNGRAGSRCGAREAGGRRRCVPMFAAGQTDPAALRGATVSLPASVVFRALAAETVMLDLRTGRYHHLEPRTGELLEALTQAGGPALAARRLAARTGEAVGAVEAELCALCLSLAQRDLLDVHVVAA